MRPGYCQTLHHRSLGHHVRADAVNLGRKFCVRKRDLFNTALKGSRFALIPAQGTFFQLAEYSAISDLPDRVFVEWLTKERGVAAIPLSVFYESPPPARYIRFCFCKEDATLTNAAAKLAEL